MVENIEMSKVGQALISKPNRGIGIETYKKHYFVVERLLMTQNGEHQLL